jgi:hypothetical protein
MHSSICVFSTVLLLFYAVGAIENHPVDLHRRACEGLPFDSVHLQKTCIVDAKTRASCAEIQRFFSNLNNSYVPLKFEKLDFLIKKRLKQEPAIQHASAGENLCVNGELIQSNDLILF